MIQAVLVTAAAVLFYVGTRHERFEVVSFVGIDALVLWRAGRDAASGDWVFALIWLALAGVGTIGFVIQRRRRSAE